MPVVDKEIALDILRELYESLEFDCQRELGPMIWCERAGNQAIRHAFYIGQVIKFLEGNPEDIWNEVPTKDQEPIIL